MQLVLSNNRVIAHGENFLAMGGVVINTETGDRYERATVAECGSCPSDIDTVGYEYHAGTFVPCAPYGKGDGNVVVACNKDCKALKDSGIPFGRMAQIVTKTYTGNGKSPLNITFDAVPVILFIQGKKTASSGVNYDSGYAMTGVYSNNTGVHTVEVKYSGFDVYIYVDGTSMKLGEVGEAAPFNKDGYEYTVTAILQGGE